MKVIRLSGWVLCAALWFIGICSASADTVVLQYGGTVEGEIVRTVNSNFTIRTESGVSTYHVNELDADWVETHYEKLERERMRRLWAIVKSWFSVETLSELKEHILELKTYLLPAAGIAVACGLAMTFFGWKLFRFITIVTSISCGISIGFIFACALGGTFAELVEPEHSKTVHVATALIVGLPLAWFGALIGRRFAMFGARVNTLGGLGAGLFSTLFAVAQFSFFEISVIWGHALIGSILLIAGGFSLAVILLALPDHQLQMSLLACSIAALSICGLGAIHQTRTLKEE